jgi:hypothetical protein
MSLSNTFAASRLKHSIASDVEVIPIQQISQAWDPALCNS